MRDYYVSPYLTPNSDVIIVRKGLATTIGLSEAIVLSVLHDCISEQKNERQYKDGNYWEKRTYQDWEKEFPYWGRTKIRGIISKLEKLGIIVSKSYDKSSGDNTKWYTINYNTLNNLLKK